MGQSDEFGSYVGRRLDHWGDEYALHRDVEYLGYASKNILAILMAHKGLPARATGFKPIESDPLAQQIEDAITELAKVNLPCANVMRAYYCGRGRRGVERYETALMLITHMGGKAISLRHYHTLRSVGDSFVADELLKIARAA